MHRSPRTRAGRCLPRPGTRRAFTIVELLVVISIIALLISLLLPALSRARQQGRTLGCAANMRSMALAAASYAQEHRDQIVGSTVTSGLDALSRDHLLVVPALLRSKRGTAATFNGIAVQNFDHYGPLAHFLGMQGPGDEIAAGPLPTADTGAVRTERGRRFDWLRRIDAMRCPENALVAIVSAHESNASGVDIGPGPLLSYHTTTAMVTPHTGRAADTPVGINPGSSDVLRRGYTPRTLRVGSPAVKAFLGEGARYGNETESFTPSIQTALTASYGGAFSDVGPWYNDSDTWARACAPGEALRAVHLQSPHLARDLRPWSFRHNLVSGAGRVLASADANIAFFDGHVESRDDATYGQIRNWLPAGTAFMEGHALWASLRTFFPSQGATASRSAPYTVP